MPPAQSTAASGMFPTEQTNASAATIGPTSDVLEQPQRAAAVRDEERVEEAHRQQRDVAGDQEAGDDLLPEHLASRRGSCARRPTTPRARRASAPDSADHVLRGPACAASACARASSSSRRVTKSRTPSHISAMSTMPPTNSASVNCQPRKIHMTIPSSNTRFVDANWNAIADGEARALLEERLRDRDRRVAARRRRRAEAGRERDLARARAAERALEPRARHPRLDDSGEREAEHERPPHLPRHPKRVLETVDDEHDFETSERRNGYGRTVRRAVLFDVVGTLFDVTPLQRRLRGSGVRRLVRAAAPHRDVADARRPLRAVRRHRRVDAEDDDREERPERRCRRGARAAAGASGGRRSGGRDRPARARAACWSAR